MQGSQIRFALQVLDSHGMNVGRIVLPNGLPAPDPIFDVLDQTNYRVYQGTLQPVWMNDTVNYWTPTAGLSGAFRVVLRYDTYPVQVRCEDTTFNLPLAGVAPDAYEPDDTPDAAQPIVVNAAAQVHSLHSGSDVDWVRFSLAHAAEITLQTDGPIGDTRMSLYSADDLGSAIAIDDNGGFNGFSKIVCAGDDALPAGTYYVQIAGQGDPVPSYNLTVTAVNHPPTWSSMDVLTGAVEDTDFPITYDMLAQASNAADPDGDPLEFRIQSVNAGTLRMNGQPIAASQLLGPGQSVVWHPPANANGVRTAFTAVAWDGQMASAPVAVRVDLAAVNDAPTLTAVATVEGAMADQDFSLTYAMLAGASNAANVDGDTLSFRVESVDSGALSLDGQPVQPGQTLLGPGQTLTWRATPAPTGRPR